MRLMMMVLELSNWVGDFGCCHPISFNALRSGAMSCAHLKSASVSASPVDAYTDLMTEEFDCIGPLDCGMGSSLDNI